MLVQGQPRSPATNACKGLHFFLNKRRIESDSLIPHQVLWTFRTYGSLYGGAGASKIDFSILVVALSGIRIVAIASAFQAEYDRGFESHIPLHMVPSSNG